MSILDNMQAPNFCPECNGKSIAYIVYGMPDFDVLGEDLKLGKVSLGGCDILEGSPKWLCNSCNKTWGESEESLLSKKYAVEAQEKFKRKDAEGLNRGVMDVLPNKYGAVRCPYCNATFRLNSKMSFSENIHLTCRTRLNILSYEKS